jgi:hypothetical protein
MIKCPFCHYENEDGALFCERCTSDLSSVASSPAKAAPAAEAMPLAEPYPLDAEPMAEALPMAVAEPIEALPMAMAEPMAEAEPMAIAEPMAVAEPMPALEMAEPMPAAEPVPPPPPQAVVAPAPAPAPPPPPPTPTPAAAAPAPAPPTPMEAGTPLAPDAQPRLVVLRGQKRNQEYPIYPGLNFIGRADEKPVDIDLEEQEPPDRIWCSRQHACIAFENDQLLIEDLNSANGTYVNRTRVYPGQKRPLAVNDVVQIGNVQMKVLA